MQNLGGNTMELISKEKEFYLLLKGEKVIEHTKTKPFIFLGEGKANYRMKRGSFKIKEKINNKEPMYLSSLYKIEDGYKINMSSKREDINLEIYIKDNAETVAIEFKCSSESVNRMWINLCAGPGEHIYGCGETFTHFDLKGEKVRIWVAEHQSLNRLIKKAIGRKILKRKPQHMMSFDKYETYYSQPTFVSSRRYFVHVDSNAYMDFDFRDKEKHTLFVREVPSKIVIGKNNNFDELMGNLSCLLGRQPELPEWVYNGAILGIQGGTEIMMNKVDKALEKNMKVSAVWCQDWEGRRITKFGKQLMWNWEWDKELYPELDNAIKKLEEKNIKFMGYINPFLAIEGELYKEASKKGYTIKDKEGKDYMVKITTFPAAMIDLTNPKAFEWIKDIIKKNMIELGLAGWMADFGEYLPVDAVLFSGEDGEKIHNNWPALWAKANREAIEEAGKLGEVLFFTRAGHTETIKYSTLMWTGDQYVDWSYDDGLPSVIPASLSLAMSGYGVCHSDIGGYTTLLGLKRSKELFMRWAELATFSPIMRNHEGNKPEINVQFDDDEEVFLHYSRMSNIYSKLSPYIKSVVKENSNNGIPVMRPIFMYYDEEKAYAEKYEYLLGRDLLVAPVLEEGKSNWKVYLPKDNWVNLWTGDESTGGNIIVSSPLGYPPVFYKSDSAYKDLFISFREKY
jgi:alpha-glucosidase